MSSGYVTKQDGMLSGNNVVPWMGRTDYVDIRPGLLTREIVETSPFINFTVRKVPSFYAPNIGDVVSTLQSIQGEKDKDMRKARLATWQSQMLLQGTGNMKIDPESFKIVRSDSGAVLGTVGSRYTPIQNSDGLDILDPVIGDKAAYETAGSLHGGSVVWLLARVNKEWSVTGDDTYRTYLLVYLSHDGTKPVTCRFVNMRVVCANTLAIAVGEAKAEISIRHSRNYAERIEEAHRVLKLADKNQQEFRKAMIQLAKVKMPERAAVTFLEELVPSAGKKETKALNTRAEIMEFFLKGSGNEGKTRYDMLNGVTEYVDHARGTRVHGDKNEADLRFEATQFGSGAKLKAQAFELLLN